jgi:glycosyltransferase involved in cell wall biosynthesis
MMIAIDGQERLLGGQVVLHVGRMDARQRHKGHEVLLQAFPAILSENPEAQLVLAGSGDDLPYLMAIGQRLPMNAQRSIFMPGFVPDAELGDLYQHCCLFAMPSRAEGFGIVYMEAMRWAKPCLGSRVDAASCVIAHGETGLLVDDPGSAVEVAAVINRLLHNPEEATSMGIRGYERVHERYLFSQFKARFFNALGIEPKKIA